jgi:superfamily II DNA or RNA helicase
MPIAWKGALAQYAGRLHRLNNAKREVIIYDYADMRVPVLARMAAKRRIGYQSMVTRYWVRAICFPAKWSHRAHPRKLRDNQAIK